MNRRTVLTSGSLGLLGLTASACAPRSAAVITTPARRPMLVLPRIHASWDRIIRTTVGFRPHRPGGFVLRADKLGSKLLIHNYGHGGAGMSLSWGTAAMAADLALQQGERTVAVIGGGVVGLTTARELQRRGFAVTLYAAALPPEVTSNWSLAGFTPTSGLISGEAPSGAWVAQFQQAADTAYRRLQTLAGPRYGISWITNFVVTGDARGLEAANPLLPAHMQERRELLHPGEHPFPTPYAIRRLQLRIEPSIYLEALLEDVRRFGASIIIRKFEKAEELAALPQPVIVNCTGLGSRELFGDAHLLPIKGQLSLLVPQPEIEYSTSGGLPGAAQGPGQFLETMPRRDGIALGGVSERGVSTPGVNEAERQRIVNGHIELYSAMKGPGAPMPRRG